MATWKSDSFGPRSVGGTFVSTKKMLKGACVVKPPLRDLSSFPEDLVRVANDLADAEKRVRSAEVRLHELNSALYDHRNNPVRIQEIDIEIDKLEGLEEALKKEVVVKRSLFLAAAIAHSQIYCQDLSDKVTRALPREIRDMIYGHLCERTSRICVEPLYHGQHISHGKSKEEEASKWPYIDRLSTPLPYLFSTKYLAKDFLFELASVLYAKATFHIWDPTDIDDFLHQDFFRLGCLPKDYARKLSLVVFTDYWGQRCSSKRGIKKKLSHLNKVFQLKHQQGFRLDLHLCISQISQSNHQPTVARFHQILLPYLYDFKAAGFTVRLPLRKYHYGKNRKSYHSEMNQLQSLNSDEPEDWLVDDEELDAWKESKVIQNAFKKRVRCTQWFYADSDDDTGSEFVALEFGADFGYGSVASDEGEDSW